MTASLKPFSSMTLHELYRDLKSWNQLIACLHGTGPAIGIVINKRNECAAMIRSRLAEIGAAA